MKKGGNAFDAMVATELALAVAYLPETLVVVDLWFIEKKWRKGTLDYRERRLWRLQGYVLDAKGNVIPGKAPNLLSQ
jgi:gamma-glutamyltranspeptidase/glutathione hydrolase